MITIRKLGMPACNRGFTLIELSIVLIIVALVATYVFRSQSLVGSGAATSVIASANDLSKAIGDFRARFHYLPGDLPSAANDLQGIPAACNIGVATAGIGNGLIEAGESPCVGDHLFAAGLIKADADPANAGRVLLRTSFGTIRVIASGASGVAGFPVTSNVVEFQNLSCDAARTFDDKLDNGNFASGRVLASVASCTPGAANDPVPFIAIRLN